MVVNFERNIQNDSKCLKMNTPLGDRLFEISILLFGSIWIIGWILLFLILLLKLIFPKYKTDLQRFSDYTFKPLSLIQKYSLWAVILLFLLRLVIGWLGWAEPLNGLIDE
jgi:hypothetical protein